MNGTICIDTGCVFGGALTALRWPERELVTVPAHEVYYEPIRPLAAPPSSARSGTRSAQSGAPSDERPPGVLDLTDVAGKRIIETRLNRTVTVREENGAAALEVMSRFAIDPHWLVYLPPTMSPAATSSLEGLLEHPAEAFAASASSGVTRLICEEKHMGSRAVVVVCRDGGVAAARFGMPSSPAAGAVFTRTGRSFFSDATLDVALLDRVRSSFDAADLWNELDSDWAVLDCELLPWSTKAVELLRRQYASVGAAATAALAAEHEVLATSARRLAEVEPLAARAAHRLDLAGRFVDAYRRYCWSTDGLDGVQLAPFQVLATEGRVRALDPHPWHMGVADRLAACDPDLFRPTRTIEVAVGDPKSEAAAVDWWEAVTSDGGEGMVVKPVDNVVANDGRIAPPGIKCRGPEYLRIVYGPEYTRPEQLGRLRQRNIGHKRSLAVREWALGIEALERFVRSDPLHRVHECVFGVLALESEPVDPRL